MQTVKQLFMFDNYNVVKHGEKDKNNKIESQWAVGTVNL